MCTQLLVLLAAACLTTHATGCSKSPESARAKAARTQSSDPAFDERWSSLAKAGTDVAYIEDDRGEGLMGNVRRATQPKSESPTPTKAKLAAADQTVLPERPASEEVQRIIRSNLMSVRGCYMRMARDGQTRSGKAIVSFAVGADGKPADVRVDAPAFQGTLLPSCVALQVQHWAFPKSQKGGPAVVYPFVFVGS